MGLAQALQAIAHGVGSYKRRGLSLWEPNPRGDGALLTSAPEEAFELVRPTLTRRLVFATALLQ
jgi:hypothetical protein